MQHCEQPEHTTGRWSACVRQRRLTAGTDPARRVVRSGLAGMPAAVFPLEISSTLLQRESGASGTGWLPVLLSSAIVILIVVLLVLAVRDFRSYRQRDTLGGSGRLRDPRTRFQRRSAGDDTAAVDDEDDDAAGAHGTAAWLPRLSEGISSTGELFARAIAGAGRLTTLAGGLLRGGRRAVDEGDAVEAARRPAGRTVRARRATPVPPAVETEEEPIDWDDLPDAERTRWQSAVEEEAPLPVREQPRRRLPDDEEQRWADDLGDSGRMPHARPGNRNGIPADEHERWHTAVDTGKTLGGQAAVPDTRPAVKPANSPAPTPAAAAAAADPDELLEDLLGI